jgi:hypothetical protein
MACNPNSRGRFDIKKDLFATKNPQIEVFKRPNLEVLPSISNPSRGPTPFPILKTMI